MPLESAGPLTRLVPVDRLPEGGTEVTIEATPEERAALAADFDLPAIHGLVGRYRLTGDARRVRVVGSVEASVSQTCVVTLDPFDATVAEEVDVDFASSDLAAAVLKGRDGGEEEAVVVDQPDEIVNGQIDLGALTAEFLALGLDPYPRKPGVAFEHDEENRPDSPFAALGTLKDDG